MCITIIYIYVGIPYWPFTVGYSVLAIGPSLGEQLLPIVCMACHSEDVYFDSLLDS